MTGIELIAQERKEQTEKHNWTPEHDDQHTYGELRKTASVLAMHGTDGHVVDKDGYYQTGSNPWGLEEKLKNDDIHRLKVAGALIAAEIDRLQRILETGATDEKVQG